MITYKDIYDVARNERYSKELQKIPERFIEDVSEYIGEKKQITLKHDSDFSDVIAKTKKQLENAITLFKEFMIRRRKKILDLVLVASETGISKRDFDNMLDFEKELFDGLMKSVTSSEKRITGILSGKSLGERMQAVVFREDVGEFMDFNGEKIGGFEKGQKASVPKEIAKILIDDGKADLVLENSNQA
jgi:DNA replication initiation complex subunit (GINS family)